MSPAVLNVERATLDWPVAVWRADQLGRSAPRVWPSGFAALDAELPGGGWPGHGLTEWLLPHPGALEWRLLAPLLARCDAEGRSVLVVGPPQPPHPPGLHQYGVSARHLVWLHARTPAERLWSTEQLIKANPGGIVLSWLPQVKAAQLRRLQVLAAACETPVFICRPEGVAREASAAPLRVRAQAAPGWGLVLDILKRKGPPLTRALTLQAVPPAWQAVLPPRLHPGVRPVVVPEIAHVVVRPVPEPEHALH
ncbi:MAG: translesion DNA synthesis-associated protein ImuA [Hydrogenophaga sp.]|uniref:translesion DNA synthesis-associated protein ImuA n=1 Tax=Hydrogenophaga sp. TaxID=1904254 RepID=UPI001D52DDC9|nr:translesion DNA synthesis-associated protein ImuA [Hydrogenophaga sp.]MBX3610262.1 translesion DNA synthesis-associated protein ImuA [Hydrogenophaga sp.]